MSTLFDIRSEMAEAAIGWLRRCANALDQTDLYIDRKPILASASAVDAFVYTNQSLDRPKKRWSEVVDPGTRRLVVLGAPGSGKTFLTRESALTLARESTRLIEERKIGLTDVSVPFWTTAGALASVTLADPAEMIIEASFRAISQSAHRASSALREWLIDAASSDGALIVIDSLDELASGQIADFKVRCRLLNELPGRLIATCRTAHWNHRSPWLGWNRSGKEENHRDSLAIGAAQPIEVELAPFDQAQQSTLARQILPRSQGPELLQALDGNSALSQICRIPLLLTFACILEAEGANLSGATHVTVYSDFIRRIIAGDWRGFSPQWAADDVLQEEVLHFLEMAAWRLFSGAPQINRFTLSQWKRAGPPPLPNLLSDLVRCGLLTPSTFDAPNTVKERSWSFLHSTLLSYLAARWLARQSEAIWREESELHFWHDPDWIEFLTFLAAQVNDPTPLLETAIVSFFSQRPPLVRTRIAQSILTLHQIQPDLVHRALDLSFLSSRRGRSRRVPVRGMEYPGLSCLCDSGTPIQNQIEQVMHENEIRGTISSGKAAFSAIDLRECHREFDTWDPAMSPVRLKILVDDVSNCYRVFGAIHSQFRPIAGRIKDFIALPRANRFQALHTSVVINESTDCSADIIVKTHEMERQSRLLQVWEFQELLFEIDRKQKSDQLPVVSFAALAGLAERIILYTPSEGVVTVEDGATVVDLAYKIHTEVGHTCVGAKVNGQDVPLQTKLRNFDTVEILTQKGHQPNPDWLRFVQSRHTRKKIKNWLSKDQRRRAVEIGRKLLEREARESELPLIQIDDQDLCRIAGAYDLATATDLLAALGQGKRTAHEVLNRLAPSQIVSEDDTPSGQHLVSQEIREVHLGGSGSLQVKNRNDLLVYFARCCNPRRGEEIVAYVTRGKGVAVHAIRCPNVQNLLYETDRRIAVEWA